MGYGNLNCSPFFNLKKMTMKLKSKSTKKQINHIDEPLMKEEDFDMWYPNLSQEEKNSTYWDKERLEKFWGKNPTQEFNDKIESDVVNDMSEWDKIQWELTAISQPYDNDYFVEVLSADIYNGPKKNRVFESGSQRDDDTNKPLPNHLDAYVRMRYGYLLRHGGNHYDKGNWRKGQPTEAALESLHRHLAKFEMNLYNGLPQDEDHLSAIIFNVQLIMKNEEKEGIKTNQYYKPI
jgi:hypothetical protein